MAKAAVIPSKSTSSGPPAKTTVDKAAKTVRSGASTTDGAGMSDQTMQELMAVYKAGDNVWALSKGLWHRAQVKEIDTSEYPEDKSLTVPIAKVHYPGWGNRWDEWLTGDCMFMDTPDNEILALAQNATTEQQRREGKPGKKAGKPVAKKETPPKPVATKQVPVPITKALPIDKKKATATPPAAKKPVGKPAKAPAEKKPVLPKIVRPASIASTDSAAEKRPARGCPSVWASKTDETATSSGESTEQNGKAATAKNGRGGRKTTVPLIEPTVVAEPTSMKLDALRTKRPLETEEEGPSSSGDGTARPTSTDPSPSRIPTSFDPVLVGVVEKVRMVCSGYVVAKFTTDDIATVLDMSSELLDSAAALKQSALKFLQTNSEAITESTQWKEFVAKKSQAANEYLRGPSEQSALKKARAK